MIIVYAIKSIHKDRIYIGMTNNLERRMKQHNNGQQKSTKHYAPFEIIYSEECKDRKQGRMREKYWKSGVGKEKLRKLYA